jgi:hypothetical protein
MPIWEHLALPSDDTDPEKVEAPTAAKVSEDAALKAQGVAPRDQAYRDALARDKFTNVGGLAAAAARAKAKREAAEKAAATPQPAPSPSPSAKSASGAK